MINTPLYERYIPGPIFIPKKTNTLYWTDSFSNYVKKMQLNQSLMNSSIVAYPIVSPSKIYVDDDIDGAIVYGSLKYLNRTEKWIDGVTSGVQIGSECSYCTGLALDNEKNLYIAERDSNRVIKWSPVTNTTIVVAGDINGSEPTGKYLNRPEGIYVDRIDGSLYVVDRYNHRIQKWSVGAKTGLTVAGSSSGIPDRNAESLFYPSDVSVDEETKTVYVSDTSNHRVQRWLFNASKGETIVGGFSMYMFDSFSLVWLI
jgi:DNA-binding beta-propeller fold protein YncE